MAEKLERCRRNGVKMAEVYFYVSADKAEVTVECGMKLSEWYDREVIIDGENKKCIATLLNPRDDISAYKSHNFRCVKLEVNPKYCFVADGYLYRMGLSSQQSMKMYEESVTPVEDYRFGKYRMPECLVTCTVVGDSISLLEKKLDSPILFNSSEELYFNNLLEGFREGHDDFNDTSMYYLLNALAATGRARKIEDLQSGLAVFVQEKPDRVYTINIPNLERYS